MPLHDAAPLLVANWRAPSVSELPSSGTMLERNMTVVLPSSVKRVRCAPGCAASRVGQGFGKLTNASCGPATRGNRGDLPLDQRMTTSRSRSHRASATETSRIPCLHLPVNTPARTFWAVVTFTRAFQDANQVPQSAGGGGRRSPPAVRSLAPDQQASPAASLAAQPNVLLQPEG